MSSPSPRRSVESFDFPASPPTQHIQSPFPHYDWNHRSSSTGRFQPRRGSTASSIHSVGGALDTSYQSRIGPVRETGQNAISTLLQPPIVRTGMLPHTAASVMSTHKPPSTKDIPPVTLTNIPHVEAAAFKTYLSQIGSLYDAFQRAKTEAGSASGQPLRRDAPKTDELVELLERGGSKTQSGAPSSPLKPGPGLSPVAPPQPRRRSSGGRRAPPALTPLSTIPTVYFDENFRLENPRTFDIVSERSEVVRPAPDKTPNDAKGSNGSLEPPQAPGRKALATNAILQEKLSWYMDTVEVHLITSISTASTSFFAALGSLRELHSEASESVTKIKALREDLGELDRQMAIGGLTVIEMKRRRENLRKLTDATDQLLCIVQGLSHCDELVDQGELDLAIARLEAIENLICGKLETVDKTPFFWISSPLPSVVIDLRNLKALEGVGEGIMQLKARIGKGFEARFLETLLVDIREHLKNVSSHDTLQRWVTAAQRGRGEHSRAGSVLPAYLITSQQFRSDLKNNLIGLSTSNYTSAAASAYRDAVVREMKVIIRQYLPSSTDDDAESVASVSTRSGRSHSTQDKNSILTRNLRAMDPADAEEFYVNVYTKIGEALRRLGMQVKVLLDVTSGVGTPPASGGGLRSPIRSPSIGGIDSQLSGNGGFFQDQAVIQQQLMQALDMSSLLGEAVDAAQAQVTKVLKVRSESTKQLPLERFLRYFTLNKLFADECESISGRSGAALKGVVNTHITEYVSRFGEIEKQQLVQAMDSDRWEPKDFEKSDNEVLSRVLQGMTSDPPEWSKATAILNGISDTINGSTAQANDSSSKEKSKNTVPAIVDEEKYVMSESATVVLRGIDRFETLLAAIPSMTTEVSSSLCEYLKLFNSRLCQLILGAGARHSAGLKNINTKHLAMASQSLSFVIAILPYLRECARRHASGGKAPLAEFDNVKRLLQDQQVSIHDKLIDIMSNRATASAQSLQQVQWDNDTARQTSPNMEKLTTETLTLYKVASKFLSEVTVRMIMTPIFESYKAQLGKIFREASVNTAAGKERLLRDARLFDSRLGHIDGSNDTGAFLIQLTEAKVPTQGAPENDQPDGPTEEPQ